MEKESHTNLDDVQQSEVGDAASDGQREEVTLAKDVESVPSYDYHKRVVTKNKQLQGKLADVESKLELIRQAEMEAKGQHQALIESLRKENGELKSANQEKDQVFAWAKRQDSIRNEAQKLGCINPDHLMRHLECEGLLSEVEIGEDYKPNADDVRRVVDNLKSKSEYSYLFSQKTANTDMVTPNAQGFKKVKPTLKDLSLDEKIKLLDLNKE